MHPATITSAVTASRARMACRRVMSIVRFQKPRAALGLAAQASMFYSDYTNILGRATLATAEDGTGEADWKV